jgi:hypothetical protein
VQQGRELLLGVVLGGFAVIVEVDDGVRVDGNSHLKARGKNIICGEACGDGFLFQGLSRVRLRSFI